MRICAYCNKEIGEKDITCPFCGMNNNINWDKIKKNGENKHLDFKQSSHPTSPQQYTPKCPYCNSIDTVKISTGDRWVSIFFAGLGSGKMGKQWHCKKCGSNF